MKRAIAILCRMRDLSSAQYASLMAALSGIEQGASRSCAHMYIQMSSLGCASNILLMGPLDARSCDTNATKDSLSISLLVASGSRETERHGKAKTLPGKSPRILRRTKEH